MAHKAKISPIAVALTPPFNRKIADVRSIVSRQPSIAQLGGMPAAAQLVPAAVATAAYI